VKASSETGHSSLGKRLVSCVRPSGAGGRMWTCRHRIGSLHTRHRWRWRLQIHTIAPWPQSSWKRSKVTCNISLWSILQQWSAACHMDSQCYLPPNTDECAPF